MSCFFDRESIGWGANFVTTLERAIDECEFIVLVLSPDFCNSEWTKLERTSGMARDLGDWHRKVRPLVLHPCRHLPTFPLFLCHVQALDVSSQSLFEENYPRLCRELGGIVQDDEQYSDRTKLRPVMPLPERHRMPYRSLEDKFVGRVETLSQIYDALNNDRTAILQGVGIVSGTGGLGKSQTAIEYAHRFGSMYRGGVYWVDAGQGLTALISQVSQAAGIGIDAKAEEAAQLDQLWRSLNAMEPALLVLDNFPENEPLRRYLPPAGRVHTLITTRRQDLTRYPQVRLNALPSADGIRLLNSQTRQFDSGEAAILVERLGGLPLALELAGSFLNYRQDLSPSGLLQEIEREGEMAALEGFAVEYKDELPSGHELDVSKTFQLSWDVAPSQAQDILRAMAELAPVPVPVGVLRRILNASAETGVRDGFGRSLSELVRLSLVELDVTGNPVAHRLVLAFVRNRNQIEAASPLGRCGEVIQEEMNRIFLNPDNAGLRQLEFLVPHAVTLSTERGLSPNACVRLMLSLGVHSRTLGRYTAARTVLVHAVEIAKTFEPGHPSLANSQSNLALVLKDLGELPEARDLLRQALASMRRRSNLGTPRSPSVNRTWRNGVAGSGELPEARDLLRQALGSNQKTRTSGTPRSPSVNRTWRWC